MTAAPRPSRRLRWARRVAGVLAGTVLALNSVPLATPAAADSPVTQTWWTVNNLTFDLPVPPEVLAPGAVPPITIPVSDVPDGGSEIAGTTRSPTGALTLRYEFAEGATLGPLVLTVAEGVPATPAVDLVACPLVGEGRFETHPGGGPIVELPPSDCTRSSAGVLDDEGKTYRFEDIASLAGEDHLSVAVLPVAGRAVLERALTESLEITDPEGAGPPVPSAPVAPGRIPARVPAFTAPTFLGQVPLPPPPSVAPAVPAAPVAAPEQLPEQLVTVFRGTAAGQAAGSAVAGLVLLLLAASSVWRRGRAALVELPAPS